MGKSVGYEKRFVFAAMKLKHLILFLAMFLAACSSRHPDPVETRFIASLQAIDSLMWRQPDSALMVLIDFAGGPQADSLSVFDGHYCQLLLSELLYKNDYAQTNREELLKAVDYFDSIVMSDGRDADGKDAINRVSTDIVFLDARAHYINGVGFYENDSVVEACAEYLKALEVMEEQFEEKDLTGHCAKFMSLTYNRLADLFSGQFMTEPAIDCFKKSIHFCKIEPTSKYGISKSYSFIGKQYDMMEKYDSASIYYRLALEELPDRDNIAYRDLFSIIVIHNHYSKKSDVLASIDSMRMIAAQAATEAERITRYLTIGDIFFEEKMFDSALQYLEPVFEQSEDNVSRIQAAEYLRVIYDSLGNEFSSEACTRFLARQKKSEGENKALVSQLDNLFQNHVKRKQEKLFEVEHIKHIKKIVGTIVPIGVLLVLAIIIVAKLRSKKLLKQQQEEADRVLEVSEQKHEEELMRLHSEADKALEKNKRKYEEELKQLRTENDEQLEAMERMHQQKIGKMNADLTSKKHQSHAMLVDRAMKVYNKSGNHGDGKVFKEIMTEFDMQYPNAEKKLKEALPDFSDSEIDILILWSLTFQIKEMSEILGLSENTVGKYRSNIRQKAKTADIYTLVEHILG